MSSHPSVRHRERLWPGPFGWAMVVVATAVAAVTLSPLSRTAMVVAAVITLAVLILGILLTTPTVAVRGGELVAGAAHIPVHLLGRARVIDRAALHVALGPGSDARDFALVRSWLPGAVVVPVLDPADPTPQWLVSSRHAAALAAAITEAQAAHSEQIG
ncbi:DUF3093 domain-containing protein [Isoptericola sp. b441]|uniref:DUF3093 domain-containing protein n=1 Tax=Actinotalea lenta TaxID=3064654 RepID=A0ABT9DBF4_9CELL|nr:MULTISPECIES: DUF3093 domain-containing protein [unclassified Isoptericola]MDO8107920.1 DUF3093 domain-containing protein [Isoptericola sp. b441]MDO8120413.1 DUF3093 domain-containing protein [Isoptericola sp. b490]